MINGDIVYLFILKLELHSICLMNNFTASAKGWIIPEGPTLLGPSRICERPKTFRSSKVIKATLIRIGNTNKAKVI